jgi:hypothetical protein
MRKGSIFTTGMSLSSRMDGSEKIMPNIQKVGGYNGKGISYTRRGINRYISTVKDLGSIG